MIIKNHPLLFLTCFCLIFFFSTHVQSATRDCYSCQDIQHAANLSAIEKRMLEVNSIESLEELDDEARNWYVKFQKGGMFFDGWQEISEDVVAKVPDEEKLRTKVTMMALGVKIGCEWSKENDVRKISTSMLQDWGKQLSSTVDDSPDNLLVVINSIEYEVNELLL